MIEDRLQSEAFEAICREVLASGGTVRFQARGASMSPAIRDGEVVHVRPLRETPRAGDILLVRNHDRMRLHRLVRSDAPKDVYITRGDCGLQDDAPVSIADVLGVADTKEILCLGTSVEIGINSLPGRMMQRLAILKTNTLRWLPGLARRHHARFVSILIALLFVAVTATSQVAVDTTTSNAAELTGPGVQNILFTHRANGTNRLLVVGVEMTITNAPATTVSSVKYNGTALTFLGAHNDAGATRRVEIWYLLAPPTGTMSVSVNVNIPTAQTVGVTVGAVTFTGVDQTVPISPTLYSADGAGGTNSQLDVPSVVNGMVLDALATGGPVTVTVPSPQVSQYNLNSGSFFGTADPPDVTGVGTSRAGAPSVPIAETFDQGSNWSLGAISINPTSADIGVSTTVNAVVLGASSTYNITVFNKGPSAANGVMLSDALAPSGLTLNSVTPSAGVTCTGTGPIACTVGTLASGSTATVAVNVTASAAGYYPNTATVTDSGTPPDSNTGNNTYVALAPVQSIACSGNMPPTGGALTGVVNAYYPGTASVAAAAKSIPVGSPTGAGTIASGSLLLVIQMQDASFSTSNTVAYGNGSTGSGFTAVNNAGNYEFVYATGAVSGGAVPITGAGTGAGLVFGYTNAAATATKGQSTYQVVLVPQYATATLGVGVTAVPWNGSTGGILAIDVAGTLTLGGATVAVDGQGFRGGAGMQLNGNVGGANTDYLATAPATYTGAAKNGVDAPKGEGVAGTPLWVESAGSYLNTAEGYPSGTAGTDGSMARGAPANAGGGGTDADPAKNDQNAGGGGGANGGTGGFGGDSWSTNLSTGGEGGGAFPATIDRLALGGGGGAGSRNNSNGDTKASGGAAGGGLIFIRAGGLIGSATLTANGASSYNGTSNDAGGGGGAGGTIVVLSLNGGEGGLTLQANGGRGGDAWDSQAYSLGNRHGPGGGGGGGVVYVSGPTAGVSVLGGAMGLTLNPGVAYGATAGSLGLSATTATLQQVTGVQSGALCIPDLTLNKTHTGNFVRGSAALFTITVQNIAMYGPTSGVVTMNDTLPVGLTPSSATGTGWACSTASQTVSCVRADALAASSSYPNIALNVNVAQTAPAVVTNTAQIGGGGEANVTNDIATDTVQIISSADLSVSIANSPDPVAAGSNIAYAISVNDLGPSAADSATLVFAVPANTTFVSVTPPAGWSCSSPAAGSTGSVTCTTVTLAGGTAASFGVSVKVNNGTANGTVISGTALTGSSVNDPVPANNSATASTTVGGTAPNLSVINAASPKPVQAGANITYTQIVTNTGTTAVTGATFNEPTPANTTFVSITPPAGWSCVGFPPAACTDPSVAGGATGTFTVVYTVNAATPGGTVITDTATVNGSNQSYGASAATATDVVATAAQADVSLSTAAAPVNVLAGNNITYTQTVSNNGPATATNVMFSEAIPANTTIASYSAPAGWTCTVTTSITCSNPSVAAGTSVDILVVFTVSPTTAAGTITANSSVSTATSDPNSTNNSTTVVTNVNVACDLTTTDTGTPSPVAAGGTITYTQTVYNHGPSNCSTGTIMEATPTSTTFVSAAVVTTGGGTWTCPNAAPISCTNPSVPPGSLATLTAKYLVSATATAGTLITDTVTAATTSHDTNPSDNAATVTIAVAGAAQADLSVTNSGSPNSVTPGSNITYTQTVTNNGPAAASTVVFNDPLPANTTAVSLTAPGWTCSIATTPPSCTLASLASGTTGNFTFVVTLAATAPAGPLTQTDSVSATTGDPNIANNSAVATVQVSPSADLSVSDSAAPVPVQAGNTITYTQVITNSGPSTATTVSLTESLPANTTAQTLTGPAGWTCNVGTLTCTNPTLATGPTGSFSFVVKVNGGTAAGTAILDSVTVTSAVSDPNSANNTATASDVVATATQADLVVTNSPSSTSVAAGSNVTYTQTVTNNGPAAATAPTFSETIPPNETFQSMVVPSGWSCTTPAIGATGIISCTDGSSLATAAPVTFTVVLGVNAATASGTFISDTATASASNIVPSLVTNSATATVLVASAGSADVGITKSGAPNPVLQGGTLTYTLTVTNNGPATATNVIATDILPASVTFLSVTPSTGTCSEADGTVTCQLGSMTNGAVATVAILTIAASPGMVMNTATVTASQADPNPLNNTATQTETITYPTRIQLQNFQADRFKLSSGPSRTVLTWSTSEETQNLGFNVYRDDGGQKIKLNPSLIAGSALLMKGSLPKHGAKTYTWFDQMPTDASSYWLEDVDVSGARTMHGPVNAATVGIGDPVVAPSSLLNRSGLPQGAASFAQPRYNSEQMLHEFTPTTAQIKKQFELAGGSALKLYLKHEGWYRVTQPELVKAGLDPGVDPDMLQLFAEAIEQPMEITGATSGPGGFGVQAAILFYGTGMDTQYTGTRVYWLVDGKAPGRRIHHEPPADGSNAPPLSFESTVELKPRSTYFAALITKDGDNFFGPLVSSTPLDQTLFLEHLEPNSNEPAHLDIRLRGVIVGNPHDVSIVLNGIKVGDLNFVGEDEGRFPVDLPPGALLEGRNSVTLTSVNPQYDYSLVDTIRIAYPHKYSMDQGRLKFTGRAGEELAVTGQGSGLNALLDITDPAAPVILTPRVATQNGQFEASVLVPWSSTNDASGAVHTLLAVQESQVARPLGLRLHQPSTWHSKQPGANIAMITAEELAPALKPLEKTHVKEGKSSVVVTVTSIYDEFNFGERSPYAIREFLQAAEKNWTTPPSFLLLNGRASIDPRNYLGFGRLDMVPTKIVPTPNQMTASDDWFSDFSQTNMPTVATGRLPVGTPAEADLVVSKIASYSGTGTDGAWTGQALFVSDRDDTESFSQDSLNVQAKLPSTIAPTNVFASALDVKTAQEQIFNGINSGKILVNYLGHGSEDRWSGENLLNSQVAMSLTNGNRLPVFLIMDCLNGFFQDVTSQPLGVSLMLAPKGGAVAVMASSGLNQPLPQFRLDRQAVQNLFQHSQETLGAAVLNAKRQIGDPVVRKTYILFGDPAMRIKIPQPAAATQP